MEIVKISSMVKPEDVFVDIVSDPHNGYRYNFLAYKGNLYFGGSDSGKMKLEEFLSSIKHKVGENGRIVVNDLDFDFDELVFREKNG